jgi:hypothetical protein
MRFPKRNGMTSRRAIPARAILYASLGLLHAISKYSRTCPTDFGPRSKEGLRIDVVDALATRHLLANVRLVASVMRAVDPGACGKS